MKIFSAEEIKQWDEYTIQNEPISSIQLMERAARLCYEMIAYTLPKAKFAIFCGPGNNGGDGLAIARMLLEDDYETKVYLVSNNEGSTDFKTNLQRLESDINVELMDPDSLPDLTDFIVIDAIFGYGLNKPITGNIEKIIRHINQFAHFIISIDIPSGLFADKSSLGNPIIKANLTLTFQIKKMAFYMPENAPYCGEVKIIDISLHPDFLAKMDSLFQQIDPEIIRSIYRPRKTFTNKGNFGTACLIAGSHGMMGAAVLSAQACIRSGVGKLVCHTCEAGYSILQSAVPEAMCSVSGKNHIANFSGFSAFDCIGIGPGIGKYSTHKDLIRKIFENYKKPMVIDADALNVMSDNQKLYKEIPANSIITPHPKEFERLFGKCGNDFSMRGIAMHQAAALNIYIVLKGHHTFIATPSGKGYFNATGNPGMATGGSGDVLTGILTSLLAQKYTPEEACLLGVYLHGLAGDLAAKDISEEALIGGDISGYLGKAFLRIATNARMI